ncbi:MAG: bifunctional pyr operon transcriptional regulator/uracil phosphoribosyltransferase PyrR [Egibacteraceae bacterium]
MSVVLTADDVRRVLRRMAHELLERNRGTDFVLLGIRTRGVPIAKRLAAIIAEIEGVEVAHGSLDVTLYRDDYARTGPRPLGRTELPGSVDGETVVLVDDVLFTGRTIRAALDALTDAGRPRAVQLAVLVDRGHRELPVRADVVGKNLPTAPGDQVRVRLLEDDGVDEVVLSDGEVPA